MEKCNNGFEKKSCKIALWTHSFGCHEQYCLGSLHMEYRTSFSIYFIQGWKIHLSSCLFSFWKFHQIFLMSSVFIPFYFQFLTNILRFAKCMVKSTGLSGFLLLFKDQVKLQLQLKSWDNEEQRDSGHVVHCCTRLSVGMMLRQKKQYDRYKDHLYIGN